VIQCAGVAAPRTRRTALLVPDVLSLLLRSDRLIE
jgi:hypothetical protein